MAIIQPKNRQRKHCKSEVSKMSKIIKPQKSKNNGSYKHGGKGTKLYEVWYSMRRRCNCQNSNAYKYYGGRGISVCKEWANDFSKFREWAIANGYREGLSIDRIDVNGNYEPQNCRWTTAKEQANNQRNTLRIEYKNKTKILHEWAEILGIKPCTLYYRLFKLSWDKERAFNEKVSYDKFNRKALKGGAEQ